MTVIKSSNPQILHHKVTDFTPDDRNANKGTQRGLAMLEDSLSKYGAGRSILVDKNGRIIAGNKTQESAIDIGIEDALVVQTDGKQLVVVQRTDIDLDSKQGRELAIADNRVAELDLAWSAEQLAIMSTEGIDLSPFWFDDELLDILNAGLNAGLNQSNNADAIVCPHCGKSFALPFLSDLRTSNV